MVQIHNFVSSNLPDLALDVHCRQLFSFPIDCFLDFR
jgi:hypothetical protein